MGRFVIKEAKTGYKFDLKATNGQVVASSQIYKSLITCKAGIEAIRAACVGGVEDQTAEGFVTLKHPKFEVYADKAGEFRFRLKARNGQTVAVSEGYKTLKNCLNGVDSVKKNAPDAPVEQE